MNRLFILLALACLAAAPAGAPAAAREPALPSTPAGRLAAGWLAVFNSGDVEAMRAFTARVVTPEDLVRRPMEQRLATYRRMKDDLGTLTIAGILDDDPARLTALATTSAGERVAITFETRAGAPAFLAGIRIEEAGDGEDALTPPEAAGPPLGEDALRDSVDAFLARPGDGGPFSGVVHAVRGDRVLYSRAFGLADRAAGTPNTLETRFNLGSINKLFTTVAIAQLAAAGKLGLDDRLSRHLPDYPRAVADRITIRHLVEHRSGLGDFFGPGYDADPARLLSLADFVPLFRDAPLRFEPGTDRAYSNAGFILLGLVIEKVSGLAYDDYMARHVFAPAGMTATGPSTRTPAVPGMATGYTRRAGRGHGGTADAPERPNTESLPGRSTSAGGGYSTAGDLVKFAHALREGRLVPAAFIPWTLGGDPPVADGPPPRSAGDVGVAGGAPGLNATLHLSMDQDLVLVVLANQDPPAAERRARALAGLLRRARRPAS
jgi:D-alanyl-D-alanine carboxypeptidase